MCVKEGPASLPETKRSMAVNRLANRYLLGNFRLWPRIRNAGNMYVFFRKHLSDFYKGCTCLFDYLSHIQFSFYYPSYKPARPSVRTREPGCLYICRRRKAIEGRRQKLYSTFNMLPSVCETNSGAYMHWIVLMPLAYSPARET